MMTEFEVRRKVHAIRTSPTAPMRKARLLLRLGRKLDSQLRSLSHARAQIARTADRKASAALLRMTQRTERLHDDVRELALRALKAEDVPGIHPN